MRRRTDEGQMAYNSRTHRLLHKWFLQTRRSPIYVKLLSAVFKQAWREKAFKHNSTSNLVALCRNYRNRQWWESMKDLQQHRAQEGLVRNGMGYRCEWEDVFCTAFDVSWRQLRDECEAYEDWKVHLPKFLWTICTKWGLPTMHLPKVEQTLARTSFGVKRRKVSKQDLPEQHSEARPELEWDGLSGRFVFVVDCKPLSEVMNGSAPLRQLELAPAFERMTADIFNIISIGWTPSSRHADPVVWHRREFNKIADFAVNYTMDLGLDWEHCFKPPIDFKPTDANLVCHSDGGTRAGQCSSAGWFLEAIVVREDVQYSFPIAMAGKFVNMRISAFSAEVMALEEAIKYVHTIISKQCGNCIKRARLE